MTMNYTTEVEQQVINMTAKGRTAEDITVLLFMNEEYPTKAECRKAVTAVLEANDIVPQKKVSMKGQLHKWYIAQGSEALSLTKEKIKDQVVAIGMSGGSVNYYTDMYLGASNIAKELLKQPTNQPTK